jgi:hypothetical protein
MVCRPVLKLGTGVTTMGIWVKGQLRRHGSSPSIELLMVPSQRSSSFNSSKHDFQQLAVLHGQPRFRFAPWSISHLDRLKTSRQDSCVNVCHPRSRTSRYHKSSTDVWAAAQPNTNETLTFINTDAQPCPVLGKFSWNSGYAFTQLLQLHVTSFVCFSRNTYRYR